MPQSEFSSQTQPQGLSPPPNPPSAQHHQWGESPSHPGFAPLPAPQYLSFEQFQQQQPRRTYNSNTNCSILCNLSRRFRCNNHYNCHYYHFHSYYNYFHYFCYYYPIVITRSLYYYCDTIATTALLLSPPLVGSRLVGGLWVNRRKTQINNNLIVDRNFPHEEGLCAQSYLCGCIASTTATATGFWKSAVCCVSGSTIGHLLPCRTCCVRMYICEYERRH